MAPADGTAQPPRALYGILGMPLGHSMSPALHTWGFGVSGHAGAYFAWEKAQEDLPAFFQAVRTLPISGLSVTIPHKQAIQPFLDEVAPRAQAVGAVNTVFWQQGRLIGENTDVEGFLAPLRQFASGTFSSAFVLGAGGVCRAALAGLRELGISTVVAARDTAKAAPLAHDFACRIVPWEERVQTLACLASLPGSCLVINATPLGMHGEHIHASPLPDDAWNAMPQGMERATEQGPESVSTPAPIVAYDLVYNPLKTRFLAQARAHGWQALDGLTLFVAQGLAQFRLWTGHTLPLDEARAFVQHILTHRSTGTPPQPRPASPLQTHS